MASSAELKRKYFPDVGDSTLRRALANMGLKGRERGRKPSGSTLPPEKRKKTGSVSVLKNRLASIYALFERVIILPAPEQMRLLRVSGCSDKI